MARPPIKYDFSEMEEICARLIESRGKCQRSAYELKNELNSFFRDSRCANLLVNDNTDKLFFGAMVIPKINSNEIEDILFSDKPVRICEYSIEIDGKLFNPILDIKPRELIAILLHEIGHVVNTSEPIADVRRVIDEYCAKNHETLVIANSVHYRELLTYGIKEYIAKRQSLFALRDDEILADEFVHLCGFSTELDSIMDRIVANGMRINSEVAPYISLIWTIQILKNVKMRRIGALKVLSRAKSIISSKLEKMEIENAIRRLNRIDDSVNENVIVDMYKEKIGRMKYNSLKEFEDDFYEYNMRARNLEEEDDALYLMRQVNVRISIIDDYLTTESNKINEVDKNRWMKLLDKYRKLREKISNTHTYRTKSYGVLVKYPEIKENNY